MAYGDGIDGDLKFSITSPDDGAGCFALLV
jgi:hypothetical protein